MFKFVKGFCRSIETPTWYLRRFSTFQAFLLGNIASRDFREELLIEFQVSY